MFMDNMHQQHILIVWTSLKVLCMDVVCAKFKAVSSMKCEIADIARVWITVFATTRGLVTFLKKGPKHYF